LLAELTERVSKLVDGAEAIGFNVKFDLGDTGLIHVAGENAPMVVSNDDGTSETTLKIAAEDLIAMFSGDLNAMMAYMQGKLVIEGDIAKAMQLSSLFG
jgi:putative sterol carrier protein